jgi:C4-dicarboxylate transporter DctQ subunit
MKHIFTLLGRIEEVVLSLTFLGLALIAVVQVVCRYGFDISFTWFEEGGRYIGIFATFLGAGLGVKHGAHFSMDLLVDNAGPLVSRILQLLIGLLCGSALFILAWYGFDLVLTNYHYGNTSPAMRMPMYIAYLPIPFFSVIMALRFYKLSCLALLGKIQKQQERPL